MDTLSNYLMTLGLNTGIVYLENIDSMATWCYDSGLTVYVVCLSPSSIFCSLVEHVFGKGYSSQLHINSSISLYKPSPPLLCQISLSQWCKVTLFHCFLEILGSLLPSSEVSWVLSFFESFAPKRFPRSQPSLVCSMSCLPQPSRWRSCAQKRTWNKSLQAWGFDN